MARQKCNQSAHGALEFRLPQTPNRLFYSGGHDQFVRLSFAGIFHLDGKSLAPDKWRSAFAAADYGNRLYEPVSRMSPKDAVTCKP